MRRKIILRLLDSVHGEKCAIAADENSRVVESSLSSGEWFSSDEAAEYLRISVRALFNLTSAGKVPHFKFGRRNRYRVDDLRNLLSAEPRGVKNGN